MREFVSGFKIYDTFFQIDTYDTICREFFIFLKNNYNKNMMSYIVFIILLKQFEKKKNEITRYFIIIVVFIDGTFIFN